MWRMAIFCAAYVLGCGFAQALAVVPGITVSIWPPGGVFLATLILTHRASWPWWVVAGFVGETIGQLLWFHSPPAASVLIFVGNALGAAMGACLLNRACRHTLRLETLRDVVAFIVIGGGFAPLVSATVGSATLAWFGIKSQTFTQVWPLFWIGDATGVLLIAPLTLVVIQQWRSKIQLTAAQWIEAGVLAVVFLGLAVLSMSTYYLPFAYIIMPPLLWAAVRFEFKGVALALTLLALITVAITMAGDSQFVGDPAAQKEKQVMLHLFLAISAFSALIIAAISRQHHQALETLRRSERELRELVDAVPAMIWSMTREGEPSYINRPLMDTVGMSLEDLSAPDAARSLMDIHPDDRDMVGKALTDSLSSGVPFVTTYRQRRADGSHRWTEGRAEPLRDEAGNITKWYGVCVDIHDRVIAQEELRASKQQLQQMVDALPVNILSLDPAGKLTYSSKRYLESLATPADIGSFEDLIRYVAHPDDLPELLARSSKGFASGQFFVNRFRRRDKNGAYPWVEGRIAPLRDMNGEILQWYIASIDVEDEMRAQAAVKEREQELSLLIDMVPSHVWRLKPDGEPTFYNKRLIDFLGFDVPELEQQGSGKLASAIAAVIHPDDAAGWGDALNRSFSTGEPLAMRYRMRRADGAYRWVESRAEPLRDEAGNILHWFGANLDIDDLLTAQDALREREAKIRRLVDSDIIGIVMWDLDGTLIDANDAFLRMVQYERKDVEAGLRWFDMTPPEWQEAHALEEAAELAATGRMQAREKEYFRKDGSRVPVLIGAACFEGQSRQGVAYILDLSELKRTESELRASKQQLEQMIDAVPINILSFDPSGRLTYASKRYLGSVGAPGAHIENFDALAEDLAHPDDFPEMFRRAKEGFSTGQPFINRFRRRTKDGIFPWIEARAAPLRAANGEIVQWYIVSIDIEDEMRALEALRARERELSLLVETLPALIYCAAPDGKPIYRSRQLSEYLGFSLEDKDENGKTRLNATLDTIIHPDDIAAVQEKYSHSLATGEPYALRHRLRRFDGNYRWVETRTAAMRNDDGQIVQWNGVCFDIDAEVRAQESLRLAQENLARAAQAASLSELSASIAHEINQPLAAIVANSHACQRWLAAEPPNIERAKITAERIVRDANSAADVVSHIRALFRQTPDARSSGDVNRLISEVCKLMADEVAAKNGRIEIDLESDLPLLPLDRVQLQQVFVNLIRNALEAMESAPEDARFLKIRSLRNGNDAIQVEVADAGTGFVEADRIFEPFFTTKPQGMGMGLAICRSIIESHGGRLWTANNETGGATVAFALPLSPGDNKAVPPEA
jgi:PAS domain S-box-containing protein